MKDKAKKTGSALNVQKGIEQPAQFNPALAGGLKKFRKEMPAVEDYLEGIRKGDRSLLSRAITLIESARPGDQDTARALVNQCLPHAGNSVRIGITGVPGAGKSTFIESFGLFLIEKGHRVAVLAVDPSSRRSKGSILGDKTRMENLGNRQEAFIRPTATAGTLGGVARATREAVVLCETAGYDIIIIETVGVGQSETAVSGIVDFFLLLQLAGGGDELQGIKRGIMEMADLIIINKADGDNIRKAELAQKEYEHALHLFPKLPNNWTPKVITASAMQHKGLDTTWEIIESFVKLTRDNGHFDKHRRQQALQVLHDTITRQLQQGFFNDPSVKGSLEDFETQIMEQTISPYEAARLLLEMYRGKSSG